VLASGRPGGERAARAAQAKPAAPGRGSLASALQTAMVSEDDDAGDWRAEARAEAGNADVERSAPPSRFERMKARPAAAAPHARAARRPDARRALGQAKKDAAKADKVAKVEKKKRRGK
jgi:hypothetical protein